LRRISVIVGLVFALSLLSSCGSEAPHPGNIHVSSEPDGAAIFLDGQDTGHLTPAILEDLEGGDYTVKVAKEGFAYNPDTKEAEVPYGGDVSLDFETGTGAIQVTSTYDGAAIYLDGEDSGLTTPATLSNLDPGTFSVTVSLDHHRSEPTERTVEVVKNQVTPAEFELALTSVVLFEGFSNVECAGCVDMAASIEYLYHDGGYDHDSFIYVKFSGPFPDGFDPFYRSNLDMNNSRAQYYFGTEYVSLPKIVTQGVLPGGSGNLIDTDTMIELIDTGNVVPVDFYLTAQADNESDLAIRDVECDIELVVPHNAADLTGYELQAVLLYTFVTTEEDYNYGGDEYHWIARSIAVASSDLGAFDAGSTTSFNVTLTDPDPEPRGLTPEDRCVVVFVQKSSDKSIIQAGSTLNGSHALTAQSIATPNGGSQ